jgi:ribosomal protein S18 acetylase RimI-like enzyme
MVANCNWSSNSAIFKQAKSMNVTVRWARVEDCAAIERLAAALNAAEGNPTDLFTQSFIRQVCFGQSPSLYALVAAIDGPTNEAEQVIGMALFHQSINTGFGQVGSYLNDLYVDQAYRRRGIARALMAEVAAATRREGRGFIWWTVKPKNADGMAFYRSLGAGYETVLAHAVGFGNFDVLADLSPTNRATDH